MCKITVILKTDEQTYKQDFLCYDEISIENGYPNSNLSAYISEAKKGFGAEATDIQVKISLTI